MELHLDTNITLELWAEGLANEVRHYVNRERKAQGLKLGEPLPLEAFERAVANGVAAQLKDTKPWIERGYLKSVVELNQPISNG
jgi:hypothetical protein